MGKDSLFPSVLWPRQVLSVVFAHLIHCHKSNVTCCWFVLKDEANDGGKFRDKVIASQLVNLKLFATIVPSQSQIEVHLQPSSSSSKLTVAALHLTLSCVFLRQGKATYVMLDVVTMLVIDVNTACV